MPDFLKGLVIGFSIAAPVGPIGLLCIQRSLNHGRMAGFASGLGAATADALYGVVAVLGLTVLTNALLEHRNWLQLGGGVFLLYLGVATLRARSMTPTAEAPKNMSLGEAFASTLGLTLMNPMTILSFIGIFAGLGVGGPVTEYAWAGVPVVIGVFLGSAAWWLMLSASIGWIGGRLQHGGLRTINIISGAIIAAFGAWQLREVLSFGF